MKLPLHNVASNMLAEHPKKLRPMQVKSAVHTCIYWDVLFVHPNKDKINATVILLLSERKPANLHHCKISLSRKADTYYLCVI